MKTYQTLKELVEQLELPDYKTKDRRHDLSSNAAFIQLKALSKVNNLCLSDVSGLLSLENTIEELKQMSNNYEVIDGCFVIQKNILDAYIDKLESVNINKIEEVKYVNFQACPICNGRGETLADECTSVVYQICDVCKGRKIIPMAELKELT